MFELIFAFWMFTGMGVVGFTFGRKSLEPTDDRFWFRGSFLSIFSTAIMMIFTWPVPMAKFILEKTK